MTDLSNYNSVCPKCSSPAYQGFAAVECSNDKCSNWDGKGGTGETGTTLSPFAAISRLLGVPPSFVSPPAPQPTSLFGPAIPIQASPWLPSFPPVPPSFVSPSLLSFPAKAIISKDLSGLIYDKNMIPLFDGEKFYWDCLSEIIVPIPGADLDFSLLVASQVLAILKRCSTNVLIAGGFARDLYLARYTSINDIDFFTEGFDESKFTQEIASSTLLKQSKQRGGCLTLIPNSPYPSSTIQSVSNFEFVNQATGIGTQQVQVIDCDNIMKNILQFDFGINMNIIGDMFVKSVSPLSYDIQYHSMKFFLDSVRDESLDFFPRLIDSRRLKNLTKRKEKMLQKFPNFRIQIK